MSKVKKFKRGDSVVLHIPAIFICNVSYDKYRVYCPVFGREVEIDPAEDVAKITKGQFKEVINAIYETDIVFGKESADAE